jgi:mono/diheme cytochrome c family protein
MCCLSRLGTSLSVVVCLLASHDGAPLAWAQEAPVPPSQPPPTSEVRPRMREHFAKGAAIRDAVIRADLEAARAPAKWLADHPQADLPESAQPNILEMRRLAADVAAAKDLPQAARGVARLASACGACHTAIQVTPTLMAAMPRREDETLAGHMRKHYRAADLLYRGLVVPSEHSWNSGAAALAGDPAELELRRGPTARPEVEALARRLHDLAQEAGKARDPKARSEVYGRMLETCSGCHKLQKIVIPQGAGRG